MPPRRRKQPERLKSQATDASKKESDRLKSNATDTDKKVLNVLQADLKRRAEESESSQLSNHSPEQLEKLIEAKKLETMASKAAHLELQGHIETVINEINKIPQNLPRGELIKQQLTIIENSHLKNLLSECAKTLKKEKNFLEKERIKIEDIKNRINKNRKKFFDKSATALLSFFESHEVYTNIDLEFPERCHILNIAHYYDVFNSLPDISSSLVNNIAKKYNTELKNFWNTSSVNEFKQIAPIIVPTIQAKSVIAHWDYLEKFTQEQQTQFKNINLGDYKVVEAAWKKILRADDEGKYRLPPNFDALKILSNAYFKQLTYLKKRNGENIDKEKTLKESEEAWKNEQSKGKLQKAKAQKFLQENAKVEYDQKKFEELCSSIKEDFKKIMYRLFKSSHEDYHYDLVSFYDFVEKNITHRLPNSLDELKKKGQEALYLFDEEIKELEWLHSQQQSELPDQPQVAMEKPSPADKLQEYLEAAFKDLDITPQRRHIVTSYLSGLFEKSPRQSLDDATIAKFCEENIKEARQVGEYLEQKHFAHKKIRDDVIQLAIHLKHEFGFPLHQANIDADFNIIQSDPSKDDSSSTSRLDIDHQGRILKDTRVQRVYLIGLQDPPEASSSHTQSKPRALLAIQSADAGYLKYGAGTPLPIGGVVDVVTAQHTTSKQPNLYKATLAIETLQETHDQKEIDPQTLVVSPRSVDKPKLPSDKPASSGRSPSPLERETAQTLELFETETVMRLKRPGESSSKTSSQGFEKIPLYDVTTFVGTVKDRPHQATPHNSGEYRETTGPCMVDLEKLISDVKDVVKSSGNFCPSPRAMMYIKRQIARQVLGEEKVPTSDQGWQTNGERHWADFHEYSTSMNMFAKYLVLAYRDELGLSGTK